MFNRFFNLFDYLNGKLKCSHEVVSWCLFAACNICSNGKDIIKEALKSDFVLEGKRIYFAGDEQVRH